MWNCTIADAKILKNRQIFALIGTFSVIVSSSIIFTNIKTFLFSLRQKRPCGTGRRSMLRKRSRWRRRCQGWCGGCPEQSSDPGRRQRWRVSAAVLGWSLTPFLEWTDNVYWQLRIKTLQYSLQINFCFCLSICSLKQRMLMCVCNWTKSTYILKKVKVWIFWKWTEII